MKCSLRLHSYIPNIISNIRYSKQSQLSLHEFLFSYLLSFRSSLSIKYEQIFLPDIVCLQNKPYKNVRIYVEEKYTSVFFFSTISTWKNNNRKLNTNFNKKERIHFIFSINYCKFLKYVTEINIVVVTCKRRRFLNQKTQPRHCKLLAKEVKIMNSLTRILGRR